MSTAATVARPSGGARVTAIVNVSARQAGSDSAEALVTFLRERYGIDGDVALPQNSEELTAYARMAARQTGSLVIAAGGDGTINAVAAQLIHTDKRLGIIPLGTLNHFAKDLGLPLDPLEAARVVVEGVTKTVDVASVNGRFFLNNSSLGVYPQMVSAREAQQERGRNKWLAWLPALCQTVRRYPVLALSMNADERALVRRTPIVFVGNNRYELEGLALGSRTCLDAGQLHVSVMRHNSRWELMRLMLYALLGKLADIKEFDSLCTTELSIGSRRRYLEVALDGEVVTLPTPLSYRIHPHALQVMVPGAVEPS